MARLPDVVGEGADGREVGDVEEPEGVVVGPLASPVAATPANSRGPGNRLPTSPTADSMTITTAATTTTRGPRTVGPSRTGGNRTDPGTRYPCGVGAAPRAISSIGPSAAGSAARRSGIHSSAEPG